MNLSLRLCIASCMVLVLHISLCAQYSDHFTDNAQLTQWSIFSQGDPAYYQSLVYNDSLIGGQMLSGTEGKLVITCGNTYWYANVTGPYVYQRTWGDFTATTYVRSLDRDNTGVPPQSEFNSTGLIVRNPVTTFGENYIMVNLGMQSHANQIGSESKTTQGSTSTLYLDPDLHEGEVRIERIGTTIRTYKRTGSDPEFVLLDVFDRPDIPDTVQIGMVLNGYTDDPDIRGEFDYIYFSGGDCRIVRNGNDAGAGSLRAAIACAQDGDTITFDWAILADTIFLTSEGLLIETNLVLDTRGTPVIIHGTGLETLLDVSASAQVTCIGVVFVAEDHQGVAMVRNVGSLSLVSCAMTGVVPESVVENLGELFISGECRILLGN